MPLSILTMLLYATASLMQSLVQRVHRVKHWVLLFGVIAVVCHGILLYRWIDLAMGQNLTIFNMLSILIWLISLFILIVAWFTAVEMLVVFIFPVAIVSIVLVLSFPSQFIMTTTANPGELFHIILSIVTFAILCVAGFQAFLLALQERTLRLNPEREFIHRLPPLVTMEKLLFQIITAGFVFLSILLVTSIYYFHAQLLQNILVFQKTTLVVFAWMIFAMLLSGRYLWGWRGRKAVYCTLYGVLLLLIVYFGSKLIH